MVESRAQVVDEVPNDDAQEERRLLADTIDVEDVAAALTVHIEPGVVRVALKEGSDLVLERYVMGVRPLELGEDAV